MNPKLLLCLALFLSGGLVGCSTEHNQLSGLPIRYHNAQYDFTFYLPESWKDYSVLIQQWNAPLYRTADSSEKIVGTESGPVIVLRHPLWRTNASYQDIPIMVFTRKQWEGEHQGRFFPYAGGVISEMWHNAKYVFGLYSRYNTYDDEKNWKESGDIIASNCAAHTNQILYPEP